MIARILVAIDTSARAAHVAAVAGDLASRYGATLIPFRAIAIPQEFPAAGAGGHPDELPAVLVREATESLAAIVAPLTRRVAEPVVRVGEPGRAIIAAADELDVDLIVMGSHGFGGWDRVLGTTVSVVANRSMRNVLVVHDRRAAASEHRAEK